MDLIGRIRPVDRLVSAFNLGLAVVWLGAPEQAGFAPALVTAHVAAALLPLLFARLRAESGTFTRTLRELYPLVFVVLVWTELGLVREFLHAESYDAVVTAADRIVFGRHLQLLWMPAMPQVWFSELMFCIYFIYYPMVFGTPVVLLLLGHTDTVRRVVFGLTVGYLACYAIYVVFPVDGPSYTMARYAGPLTEGFLYRLSTGAVHAGDSMGTAFPSSHVMGAVSMAILAARWLPRSIAAVFALEALGVALSTVYTQNHFAIDSAVGVLVAFGAQLLAVPALEARLGRRRRAPPARVPALPLCVSTPASDGHGGEP